MTKGKRGLIHHFTKIKQKFIKGIIFKGLITRNPITQKKFKSNNQKNPTTQSMTKSADFAVKKTVDINQSGMRCWGCNGLHCFWDCPHKEGNNILIHNIWEATSVNGIARMPQISAALDNHQAGYQPYG